MCHSGTPSAQVGQKVTLMFAEDMLHLQSNTYRFINISNAPHAEFIITDLEPRNWYYDQEISTPGVPVTSQGNVKVEAGKTATLTVVF
jgi:hypothetical protein